MSIAAETGACVAPRRGTRRGRLALAQLALALEEGFGREVIHA